MVSISVYYPERRYCKNCREEGEKNCWFNQKLSLVNSRVHFQIVISKVIDVRNRVQVYRLKTGYKDFI